MDHKEYEIVYSERFEMDIEIHKKSGQKSILAKINSLINELRLHPTPPEQANRNR